MLPFESMLSMIVQSGRPVDRRVQSTPLGLVQTYARPMLSMSTWYPVTAQMAPFQATSVRNSVPSTPDVAIVQVTPSGLVTILSWPTATYRLFPHSTVLSVMPESSTGIVCEVHVVASGLVIACPP